MGWLLRDYFINFNFNFIIKKINTFAPAYSTYGLIIDATLLVIYEPST